MTRSIIALSVATLLLCAAPSGAARAQGGLQQRVAELSQQIASEMTQYQKTTIAVVEFSDLRGNVTDFGRFLAEELITRLHQTRKFKVIERQLLNKIIAEQKLTLSGLVDPASARQLGKLLGVDAIASGTVTDLGQSLRINARLITAETGEVFAVASTEVFKDESVARLLAEGTTQAGRTTGAPAVATAAPAKDQTLAVGRVIELSGIVSDRAYLRYRITVLELLPERQLRLTVFSENKTDRIQTLGGTRKSCTYIVDDRGDQYNALDDLNDRHVPPGAGARFTVVFAAPPQDARSLSVVLCDSYYGALPFPKITLGAGR